MFRIIKSAEVTDDLFQVLPLRCFSEPAERVEDNDGNDGAADAMAELQAQAEAEKIVDQARTDADELLHEARKVCEQIKQEAYQNAFNQGRQTGAEEGYQEGLAKAQEEAAAIREQAAGVLKQAEEIRRHTLEGMEQEIIALAREIAEKLLSTQLTLAPETVLQVVQESLSLVADRLNVILYVNPVELELVENQKSKLLDTLPARAELQMIADASVSPGGCRVETEQGWVDATTETRREELLKALYNRER